MAILTVAVATGAAGGYAFLWIYVLPGTALILFGKREGGLWIMATVCLTFPWLLGPIGAEYSGEILWRFCVTFTVVTLFSFGLESSRRRNVEVLLDRRNSLVEAAERVKTLRGLLPMCPTCKKIRDDEGFWLQVEEFVSSRAAVQFSHGLCPDCALQFLDELEEGGASSAGSAASDSANPADSATEDGS
ncbi:MAG: hypothetical protein AAGM22_05850 [Acidobacteriota bacterium]